MEEYFYPRPPRGGRRRAVSLSNRIELISIHALREEGDAACQHGCCHPADFYPRPPRGGRHIIREAIIKYCKISIHALREEGDPLPSSRAALQNDFYPRPPRGGRPPENPEPEIPKGISIHALREEGDLREVAKKYAIIGKFLSTPSARRATAVALKAVADGNKFLSTPSARRATKTAKKFSAAPKFLSTPSARRATLHLTSPPQKREISIHALREEGDSSRWSSLSYPQDFYPRPPRGGRRSTSEGFPRWWTFLSTPSARRATSISKTSR